jgi:DNA-directed RNA polymerase specialized sigma24 family protein
VLAQRYVDSLRRARRLESLTEEEESGVQLPATEMPPTPERGRFVELMRQSLSDAVSRLTPRDRLRLACYYAQNLTLAQIGRTLREHEATTSRHLARTRRTIRDAVERQLRQQGMAEAEVSECVASVLDDAGTLDLAEIFPARKNDVADRSSA